MDTIVATNAPPVEADFDPARIRAEIDALAAKFEGRDDAFRAAITQFLKGELAKGRAAAQAQLLKDRHGRRCAERLCDLHDAIIGLLFEAATRHLYKSLVPSDSERMAIVATGGYGRGLMAPESDIDLLFLLPYKQTAWGESVAEAILYCLWDMGLKVGHATRSIDESIRQARADMTIRTAVLETRFLVGDRQLYDELVTRFDKQVVQGTASEFVTAKLAEREERHRRAGQSRYLVEPNVKDGKGGLRDLHTLFWISKYVYRVRETSELVEHGVFDAQEYRTFRRCEDFLWSVRCNMHFYRQARGGAAVVRHPARDGGAARLHQPSRHAGRRALHEALLPDRQGCRRPDRHPLRQARRSAGEACAGAEPDDGEVPPLAEAAPERQRRLRRRLQPHQPGGAGRVPARSDQPDPHLPPRAEAQSGVPSGCDARREALAAPDRSETARERGGQPPVPGDPDVERRGDRAAADERDRRAREIHPHLRQDRLDDAVQHVSSLHGG